MKNTFFHNLTVALVGVAIGLLSHQALAEAFRKDPYEVLGISRNSTRDEIRKAFRRMAMRWHPDVNAGDKTAEAKFKDINNAHEILSDSEKRAAYDRYGHPEEAPRRQPSRGPARDGGFKMPDPQTEDFHQYWERQTVGKPWRYDRAKGAIVETRHNLNWVLLYDKEAWRWSLPDGTHLDMQSGIYTNYNTNANLDLSTNRSYRYKEDGSTLDLDWHTGFPRSFQRAVTSLSDYAQFFEILLNPRLINLQKEALQKMGSIEWTTQAREDFRSRVRDLWRVMQFDKTASLYTQDIRRNVFLNLPFAHEFPELVDELVKLPNKLHRTLILTLIRDENWLRNPQFLRWMNSVFEDVDNANWTIPKIAELPPGEELRLVLQTIVQKLRLSDARELTMYFASYPEVRKYYHAEFREFFRSPSFQRYVAWDMNDDYPDSLLSQFAEEEPILVAAYREAREIKTPPYEPGTPHVEYQARMERYSELYRMPIIRDAIEKSRADYDKWKEAQARESRAQCEQFARK